MPTDHHRRLMSFFRATARVRRFPRMPLLHTARSCVSSTQSFNLDMSSSTHSLHVFLGLPRPLPFILSTTIFLHADTQSSGCLRSTCPNHLSLPRLTTTETLSMSSRHTITVDRRRRKRLWQPVSATMLQPLRRQLPRVSTTAERQPPTVMIANIKHVKLNIGDRCADHHPTPCSRLRRPCKLELTRGGQSLEGITKVVSALL